MKISVAKPDLENALQVVSIGTTSSGNDISTHYVFRHQDGYTSVLSYNGKLGTSVPLVCQTEIEEGEANAFTVESWRLNQWLRAANDGPPALTLEFNDAKVTATSPTGAVVFRSLDPASFPFWDKGLQAAKVTMKIPAGRLHAALSHVKAFVSSQDTTRPEMAVTEVRDSVSPRALWATDQSALTVVTIAELAKSNLRIHGKDIPSVLQFLALDLEESVEILEHTRQLFIRRENRAVMSVGRPTQAFVDLEETGDLEDAHWWDLGVEDLDRGIKQLAAGAAKDDLRITLNFDAKTEKVTLSMTADSGSTNTLSIPCPEFGSAEDATDLPSNGWTVDYPHLQRILSSYRGGKTIRMGMFPAEEDGGWTRFVEDRNGDNYLTLLVWMPE